jgi:hypothetical protein
MPLTKLNPIFPGLECINLDVKTPLICVEENVEDIEDVKNPLAFLQSVIHNSSNPIEVSSSGIEYQNLGCFPIGENASESSVKEVISSQERLRDMALLHKVGESKLKEIGFQYRAFFTEMKASRRESLSWLEMGCELSELLCDYSENLLNMVEVYICLDSGMHASSGCKFWALSSINSDGSIEFYVSRNVEDLTGVLMHTFLSSKGCSRVECFQAEIALANFLGLIVSPERIPNRIIKDMELLSPRELLLLVQRLEHSNDDSPLRRPLLSACKAQLLSGVDELQRKSIASVEYIGGRIPSDVLIESRATWYEQTCMTLIDIPAAQAFFIEAETTIIQILKGRVEDQLHLITEFLHHSLTENDAIDPLLDLISLAVFSAVRKQALDEVYMEVCDRNASFNDQPDQAAAFAELFAVGSRCEAYFDMAPSDLGKLLSDKFRIEHGTTGHQPPLFDESAEQMTSAYAAAQIDVGLRFKPSKMPRSQQFSFLAVFAIPALIDIILLTTTGHGLYLSVAMSHNEQRGATLALMFSLLLSGAVGSWITSGGSYYLISMAFSAMNMFVYTRLIGGFAMSIVAAMIGLLCISIPLGIRAGIVFSLYLVALTMYLCLLASLATFQYPGSAFQSVSF